MRKAFTSLVFDTPNLEHLELKSKNMCKVDACVYDNARDCCTFILLVKYGIPYYSYGVGFCNLLVLLEGQVPRPGVWDEQVRSPTHFLYMHHNLIRKNKHLSSGGAVRIERLIKE